MAITRYAIGGGATLFSLLGILLCLAGIVAVWLLKRPADGVADAVFTTIDQSLDFTNVQIERVQAALERGRQRTAGVVQRAQRLAQSQADAPADGSLLAELLEIVEALKAAETWLESGQATAQGIARLSQIAAASPYAAAHEESAVVALVQRLHEIAEEVAQTLEQLQVLRQKLVDAGERAQLVRDVALQLVARIADLDTRLTGVVTRLEVSKTRIAQTQIRMSQLDRRVGRWILAVAVGISVVLAWFGVSQVGMLSRGWNLLRVAGQAEPAATTAALRSRSQNGLPQSPGQGD